MTVTLVISGLLPNLNDYITAERTSRFQGAQLKRNAQQKVSIAIREQLRGIAFDRPVAMHYLWVERNRRRDKDNISSFGRKVIQDALVQQGVLPGDGWSAIRSFHDEFLCDKACPRIVVTITDE